MLRLISNDKKLVEMYEIVAAFDISRKLRNTIYQLVNTLEAKDKTFDDFYYYLKETHRLERERIEAFEKTNKEFKELIGIPCPECQSTMDLFSVNTTPGDQTGDPTDKSMWLCSNDKCMETIYNKETIVSIIKQRKRR